jgi:hypothetical protein
VRGQLNRRSWGHRDAASARLLDRSCNQPGGLRVLDDAPKVLQAGVAAFGNADGLLHSHEPPVEYARAGQLLGESDQRLPQSRERVHLAFDEQIEGRVGARHAHQLGVFQTPGEEQLVVRPGRRGDAHALTVNVRHRAQRRPGRHQIGRFDLQVGRGEADLALARRFGPEECDIPRACLRRVDHGPDALVGDDLDRHTEPLSQLSRQVDCHATGLTGGPVLGGKNEIRVVDSGAQLPGRCEVVTDGRRDLSHGCAGC